MPNCSTMDQLAALCLIIEKTKEFSQDRRPHIALPGCQRHLWYGGPCVPLEDPHYPGAPEWPPLFYKECIATMKAPPGSLSTGIQSCRRPIQLHHWPSDGPSLFPLRDSVSLRNRGTKIDGSDSRALYTIKVINLHHQVSNVRLSECSQQPPASHPDLKTAPQKTITEHPTFILLIFFNHVSPFEIKYCISFSRETWGKGQQHSYIKNSQQHQLLQH